MTGTLKTRIFLALIGLVLGAQLASMVVVWHDSASAALVSSQQRLQLGLALLEEQLQRRGDFLSSSLRTAATAAEANPTGIVDRLAGTPEITQVVRIDRSGQIAQSTDRALAPLLADISQTARNSGAAQALIPVMIDGEFALLAFDAIEGNQGGWLLAATMIDQVFLQALGFRTNLAFTLWPLSAAEVEQRVATLVSPAPMAGQSQARLIKRRAVHSSVVMLGGVAIPVQVAEKNARTVAQVSELLLKLTGLMLFAASLALVAAVLIARGVTRPLDFLIAAARRIENGVFTHAVELHRRDEFGVLAGILDRIQVKLASRDEELGKRQSKDRVTGLPTRAELADRMQIAFDRAALGGSSIAALVVDISSSQKTLSDLPHAHEEILLKDFVRRLSSKVRVTDMLARVREHQFLILMEEADSAVVEQFGALLIEALDAPFTLPGNVTKLLQPRIGMALYPEHCETADALLRRARMAVKEATKRGAAAVMYEPGQDEEHLRQLAIVSDLPMALRGGQLHMRYQPKINRKTGEVTHAEALVRWQHPQMGFISPEEFIPLLEQTGNIGLLTEWATRTAIAQCREWSSRGMKVGVAINLSAHDLLDQHLPDHIMLLLRHHLVDPSKVVLEVTESAVMQDADQAIAALNKLRGIGIRISLDDFGTGHSSLALLKSLPIDELKIDKSFVLNLKPGTGDAVIVKSTIDLGHNMGLKVVAEGVENKEGWQLLAEYGCDTLQGYMISAPLEPERFEEWYLEWRQRNISRMDFSFLQSA